VGNVRRRWFRWTQFAPGSTRATPCAVEGPQGCVVRSCNDPDTKHAPLPCPHEELQLLTASDNHSKLPPKGALQQRSHDPSHGLDDRRPLRLNAAVPLSTCVRRRQRLRPATSRWSGRAVILSALANPKNTVVLCPRRAGFGQHCRHDLESVGWAVPTREHVIMRAYSRQLGHRRRANTNRCLSSRPGGNQWPGG